jgi:hypothetical protein
MEGRSLDGIVAAYDNATRREQRNLNANRNQNANANANIQRNLNANRNQWEALHIETFATVDQSIWAAGSRREASLREIE